MASFAWTSIYIKNLGSDCSKNDIAEQMGLHGTVSRVDVVDFARPNGSRGKNAFVHFAAWATNKETFDLRLALTNLRESDNKDGIPYSINNRTCYMFVNEKPLTIEPLNDVQLSESVRRLYETIGIQQEMITKQADAMARLEARLDFELDENRRVMAGRGMSYEMLPYPLLSKNTKDTVQL